MKLLNFIFKSIDSNIKFFKVINKINAGVILIKGIDVIVF